MAALEMRTGSQWWYGRYRQKGKAKVKNLGIKIRGSRPASITEVGSPQFENSRGEAQAALDRLASELTGQKQAEELAQAVYEARTGARVGTVLIADLPDKWLEIPRRRPPSNGHKNHALGVLRRFVRFMQENYAGAGELHEVTRPMARAFMDAEDARGVANKTWNESLAILRTTFRRMEQDAGLAYNPFDQLVSRETHTVFRVPYTPEELKAILAAAEQDDFVRPIIVTAAATAMRKGDCCLLKWETVDLADGFITVKTSKTGATADIPVFPLLYEELLRHRGKDPEYVFPAQAEKYLANPDYLTDRLRRVLAAAGFRDGPMPDAKLLQQAQPDADVLRQHAEALFATMPASPRRDRMRHVLDLYLQGSTVPVVADDIGCSKSTVSLYLNEIEDRTGVPFIRGKVRPAAPAAPLRGAVHVERTKGLRRGSVRDWHSFRTTWITLALTSKIPLELVKKVTGHKTVDVVLKHYFRPQREQLKAAFQEYMPKLLTDGAGSTSEQALALLRTAEQDNWQEVVAEAVALLNGEKR